MLGEYALTKQVVHLQMGHWIGVQGMGNGKCSIAGVGVDVVCTLILLCLFHPTWHAIQSDDRDIVYVVVGATIARGWSRIEEQCITINIPMKIAYGDEAFTPSPTYERVGDKYPINGVSQGIQWVIDYMRLHIEH
jgi:hypothetical protein